MFLIYPDQLCLITKRNKNELLPVGSFCFVSTAQLYSNSNLCKCISYIRPTAGLLNIERDSIKPLNRYNYSKNFLYKAGISEKLNEYYIVQYEESGQYKYLMYKSHIANFRDEGSAIYALKNFFPNSVENYKIIRITDSKVYDNLRLTDC